MQSVSLEADLQVTKSRIAALEDANKMLGIYIFNEKIYVSLLSIIDLSITRQLF